MNKIKSVIFLLSFPSVFFTTDAFSQDVNIEGTATTEDSTRNFYIRSYDDYFNVSTFVISRGLGLSLVPKVGEASRINFAPNGRGFIGVGAVIFDLGLAVSVKLPASFQKSTAKYGETDFLDIQGNLYGKQWNFDASYQNYRGFYLSNPLNVLPVWEEGDNFPSRRDLVISNALLNVVYVLRPDVFSFRSAFNRTEKQIRGAGSVILLASVNRLAIRSDFSLVPFAASSAYPPGTGLEDGRFATLSFLPGYSHNFVIKDFFVNVTLSAGAGVQHQKFTIDEREQRKWALEPKFNFRGGLGYDNDRFFAGSYFIMQQSRISSGNLNIDATSGNFQVYLGYRFKKFGILKRYSVHDVLDRIEERIF